MFSIIKGKEGYSSSFIKEFDDQHFYNIVKYVNDLDVDAFDIYGELYESKFHSFPDESKKQKLNRFFESIKDNSFFYTDSKRGGYEWVFIKGKEVGDIAFRYYFGINPMNLYELVEKLTKKFINYGVPVEFKYQRESKKYACDRIIMYTDFKNKKSVEKVINEVYNENKELFQDSERPLPWIYESNTPNVYIAPESFDHEKSYGEKFAEALEESKAVFHYFYQDDKIRNNEQLEFMKKVIISCMLKHGVLLESSGKRMRTYETNIKTFYYEDKNILTSVIDEKNGNYYEVTFDSSIEAKKAYLKDFYSVKSVENEPGVRKRVLSREERIREVYNNLYPNQNIDFKKK